MERLTFKKKSMVNPDEEVMCACINNHTYMREEDGKRDNYYLIGECIDKLADFEDKQEQGLLIELPVAIGADVYFIPSKTNYDLNVLAGIKKFNRVYHQKVKSITFAQGGWFMECDKDVEYGTGKLLLYNSYKETWFLTEAEAEEALAKMGE